ncbi:nuclear transport factor 2 family protein [Phreatobacter stygius]|nr:nuclear transport factor 2 family protein [Phreatobacter stygius]
MRTTAEFADRYVAMWNETDVGPRRNLVTEIWMPDAHFTGSLAEGRGHDRIDAALAAVQRRFAGHSLRLAGPADAIGAYLRLPWILAEVDGSTVARGTDIGTRSPDGRLEAAVSFFDLQPHKADAGKPAWSAASWAAFWANPDPEVARRRVPNVVRPDVTAHWPHRSAPVRGVDDYRDYILQLLALVPDLRLTMEEHVTEGDSTFIRWSGKGTGVEGPFHCTGVDRIRVSQGRVIENRIYSDHLIFQALAAKVDDAWASRAA